MRTNEVKMPKSEDYTPSAQRIMLAEVLQAQAQVDALCEKLRYSIVTACKGEFHRSDIRFKTIENIVMNLHSDSDLIADVCMDTHDALCSASKVYNYASQDDGEDDHAQYTTACLVQDYVNKVFKDTKTRFCELEKYLEIHYDEDTQVYEVYSE